MIALAKKLALFLVIIFTIQLFTPQSLWVKVNGKDLLDSFLSNGADIIFFNDSVDSVIDEDDSDRATLSEMVRRLIPEYSMGVIKHPAYNITVFSEYCGYMARRNTLPELIVIPINIRSFSPQWYMRPEWQFPIERAVLKHDGFLFRRFSRPLFSFSFFDTAPVSDTEYLNTPVYYGAQPVGIIKDFSGQRLHNFSEENIRKEIILRYMCALDEDNRILKALGDTAHLLKDNNEKAVFYITPLDHETSSKYIGTDFYKNIRANSELISETLAAEGFYTTDLSLSLPDDAFCWSKAHPYPNEHMNEKGRKYVAKQLAEIIEKEMRGGRP